MSSVRPGPKTPRGRRGGGDPTGSPVLSRCQRCPGTTRRGLSPPGQRGGGAGFASAGQTDGEEPQQLKVKVTSVVEEPVNVDGLLALLILEDGARLLLAGQGGGVRCWGERVPVAAMGTAGHGLKATDSSWPQLCSPSLPKPTALPANVAPRK